MPGDRGLPPAGVAARDRPHPRRGVGVRSGNAARARDDRGVRAARASAPCSIARPSCSRSSSASRGLDALPDPAAFDPSPEEEGELRERLLRAGESAHRTERCPASGSSSETLERWRRFPGRERLPEADRPHLRRRPRPGRHAGGPRRARSGRRAGHLLPRRRAAARAPRAGPRGGRGGPRGGAARLPPRRARRARGPARGPASRGWMRSSRPRASGRGSAGRRMAASARRRSRPARSWSSSPSTGRRGGWTGSRCGRTG